MKEIQDDIWARWDKGFSVVIPTNGFVKTNGECAMGKGLALQAKKNFPMLPLELGNRITIYGNIVFVFMKYRLITFPVKSVWHEDGKLELIEKSCKQLKELFKHYSVLPLPIYLPRVGCGYGNLNWDKVKPILETYLDDRFAICDINEG